MSSSLVVGELVLNVVLLVVAELVHEEPEVPAPGGGGGGCGGGRGGCRDLSARGCGTSHR